MWLRNPIKRDCTPSESHAVEQSSRTLQASSVELLAMADSLDVARAVLSDARLADIVPSKQDVILLQHNATVTEALKVLATHRILSAPLVVAPGLEDVESLTPGESAPSLLGWLDVRVIIQAFLHHLKEGGKELPTSMLQLMAMLDKAGPHFANKLLITIVGSDDRGLVYQADADASALSAVKEVFLQQASGVVHRLAIFDAHGSINKVVSQLDVLRYLLQHEDKLGAAAQRSITDLGLLQLPGKRALVTLQPHMPTLLAYERMAAAGVTGVAVVSDDGELIANLSVSDVRCIQPQHLGVLALPVAEFLALSHGTSYLGYSAEKPSAHSEPGAQQHPFFAGCEGGGRRTPPVPRDAASDAEEGAGMALRRITCKESSTLSEVLHMLVDNGVHRVYTVAEDAPLRVTGVITPTDILRLLAGGDGVGRAPSDGAGSRASQAKRGGSGALQAAIDAGAAVPGGVAPHSDERQQQDQGGDAEQDGNGYSKKARVAEEAS